MEGAYEKVLLPSSFLAVIENDMNYLLLLSAEEERPPESLPS